jgi:hypothetical protein
MRILLGAAIGNARRHSRYAEEVLRLFSQSSISVCSIVYGLIVKRRSRERGLLLVISENDNHPTSDRSWLGNSGYLCHITNSFVLLHAGGNFLPFSLVAIFEPLLNIMPPLVIPLLIETKALNI